MTEEARIKLLLVDNHPVVRAGIQHFIRHTNSIQIVAEANSGQEALKIARQIDVSMMLI
ncbi:MAG: hypothetical protein ACEQSE_09095 [Candidatus Aquirickettsiella gammari]